MARKAYRSERITVSFDLRRCIHARECVRGLPEVFNTEKRPWIQPDRAEPDAITTVVLRCPSGALQFEREDGVRETPPEENVIAIAENGPLYARGDIEIKSPEGDTLFRETRVALCRCGASQNKPFCDNTHKEIGFRHEGSLGENLLSSGEAANGRALIVVPITNGPYLLRGEVEIRDAAGQSAYRGSKASLCRCGCSENKPFCDGSHTRTGWREHR
jgi:CDGSH-type Zn-finger protein/uncharacterized Fe-S cluster protein YjdI